MYSRSGWACCVVRKGLWLTIGIAVCLAVSLPAPAAVAPCDPRVSRLFCKGSAVSTPVCLALDATKDASRSEAAVDRLVAAAAAARSEFGLGTRLEGSRLVACRLLELQAPDAAADVLRLALDAVLATIEKTERDEGVLVPIGEIAILQAEAGLELDFGRSLSEFERLAAAYGDPEDVAFARGLLGLGLSALGRHELARDQFKRARAAALTLPDLNGDQAPRFGTLLFLVQSESEAGVWELAAEALPDLLSAAAVIDDLPATDSDRQGMRNSVDRLRQAVERREWPPRP